MRMTIAAHGPSDGFAGLKSCMPKQPGFKCGIAGRGYGADSPCRFFHDLYRRRITFVIHSCNAIPFSADTKPVVGDIIRGTNNVTETTVV